MRLCTYVLHIAGNFVRCKFLCVSYEALRCTKIESFNGQNCNEHLNTWKRRVSDGVCNVFLAFERPTRFQWTCLWLLACDDNKAVGSVTDGSKPSSLSSNGRWVCCQQQRPKCQHCRRGTLSLLCIVSIENDTIDTCYVHVMLGGVAIRMQGIWKYASEVISAIYAKICTYKISRYMHSNKYMYIQSHLSEKLTLAQLWYIVVILVMCNRKLLIHHEVNNKIVAIRGEW